MVRWRDDIITIACRINNLVIEHKNITSFDFPSAIVCRILLEVSIAEIRTVPDHSLCLLKKTHPDFDIMRPDKPLLMQVPLFTRILKFDLVAH